ncbi:MAG: hypothetical protein V4801_10195 [Burkholderia gladioli]
MHALRKLREAGPHTAADVEPLLAPQVAFHSPIFTKAVTGRERVAQVFAQSSSARAGRFTGEYQLDARTTLLRWEGSIAGRKLESLEIIVDDEDGRIVERTVAFRPFPAVALFRDAVYPALREWIAPEYWQYEDDASGA